MAEKTKLIGRDGRTYDDVVALNLGEAHARMKKQMAEDIKKQNKLLQQDIQLKQQNIQLQQQSIQTQREIANKQINLELQKEQNKKVEANKQRKHEREMRICSLFDEAGISIDLYYDYINKSMHNDDIQKEINLINSNIKVLEKYRNYNRKELDNYAYRINNNKEPKNELTDYILECRDGAFRTKSSKELKQYDDELLKYNESKEKITTSAIALSILSLILLIIFCVTHSSIFIFSFIILAAITIILITQINSHKIDISRIESNLKNTEVFDENKLKSNFDKKINELKNDLKIYENDAIKSIEPNINKFTTFRKEHYNSTIEKLLLDVGYKDRVIKLGFKYEMVNNSNKKKDGTIEDYIEYFETHS